MAYFAILTELKTKKLNGQKRTVYAIGYIC
jgi:hypothetical protein